MQRGKKKKVENIRRKREEENFVFFFAFKLEFANVGVTLNAKNDWRFDPNRFLESQINTYKEQE